MDEMTKPTVHHFEVTRLTETEFEERLALMPTILHPMTRMAFAVDLCWSVLHFDASPENDDRQDRFADACRAAGINVAMAVHICRTGLDLAGAQN